MRMASLEESLRSLGLTDAQINETFPLREGEEDEVEVDPSDEHAEGNLDTDIYLSPEIEEDDDDDVFDSDQGYEAFVESLNDDDLEEIAQDHDLEEGFIKLASQGVRRVRRKKMKKWLKTSEGRKYMAKKARKQGTSIAKKKRKKHAKILKARGGPKKGRIFRSESMDEYSTLMEELNGLEHALNNDPQERFQEFVTAFNHVSDLGELAAMNIMDEDCEAAKDMLSLTVGADDVLRRMEKMGGTVTRDQDAMLEATLADAMDCVGEVLSAHDMLEGVDDGLLESDGFTNSFSEASDLLRESNGRHSSVLSIWDSSNFVDDSMLETMRRLRDGNR
jgi:hypothetical protein